MPTYDMIGKRFGRWTVIRRLSGAYFLCRCDCGNERMVYGANLRNGMSTSCGCRRSEASRARLKARWARLKELEAKQ